MRCFCIIAKTTDVKQNVVTAPVGRCPSRVAAWRVWGTAVHSHPDKQLIDAVTSHYVLHCPAHPTSIADRMLAAATHLAADCRRSSTAEG